ncbi:hypothetical protein PHLCEN_2v4780 [Hermanssonia centrifuga]|uniref:Uncharacterized protein n=1 Tax=Hermanssonia centrifuga TaxID=98765 RepID=A0A2R6PJ85_9APHY|nr:hypothetical protein PHLCEN_2v4780 [Hermanssonia centrifuga]
MLFRFWGNPKSAQYDALSTSEWGLSYSNPGLRLSLTRWTKRRRSLIVSLFALVGVISLTVYLAVHLEVGRRRFWLKIFGPADLPPLYPEFRQAELELPQHYAKDPFAGGQKYLWVASHTWWSGWGNFMQDMVMTAHLTYKSGRTYVFDEFTWDKYGPEYTFYNGKWIPSRIPLSAVISGPIVGGRFPDGDATPRAISKSHWQKICPHPTVVDGAEVRKLHGGGASALKIVETWVEYLNGIEDPCVEVPSDSGSMFHPFLLSMFGRRDEMLPVWPTLSQSPILTLFGWSTLAHHAFEANRHLFSPDTLIQPYVATASCPQCADPYRPLPGLLALHLRRGDFIPHCPNLAHWGAGFNAFNSFPEFPDQWQSPQGDDDERMAVYLRRCLPTIEQIVEKIEAVRNSTEGLRNIYIMTNGDKAWLAQLEYALRKMHVWDKIATSRDMVQTPEEIYISQATDMLIGQRAQVLIGNGVSVVLALPFASSY